MPLKVHPALRHAAIEVLVRTGAIEPCPEHAEIFLDHCDDQAVANAFVLALDKVKFDDMFASLAEMQTAVHLAYEEAVLDCPECERERLEKRDLD